VNDVKISIHEKEKKEKRLEKFERENRVSHKRECETIVEVFHPTHWVCIHVHHLMAGFK
jgi:hypothetical protein